MVGVSLLEMFRHEVAGYNWQSGLFAAAVGALLLCFGWNLYRPCLVVSGILSGVALGTVVSLTIAARANPVYLALAGGLLLGIVAVPLFKASVVLTAGIAGALFALGMVHSARWSDFNKGTAVLLAFLLCAGLAVLLFRFMVTFVFSAQGAVLICTGLLAVCQATAPGAADWLYGRPLTIWVPFYLLFFIGMVTQMNTTRWLQSRKDEKAEVAKARRKVRKKYGKVKP